MFNRKQPSKNAKIDTLIGAGTRISGDVEFAGGLHLDGHISGNVKAEPGAGAFLSVSGSGCVEGSVMVPSVILNGIVKGDIEAADRVELGSKAQVSGNVRYGIIETAVGAQIKGKLIHRENSPAKAGEPGPGTGELNPAAVGSGDEE